MERNGMFRNWQGVAFNQVPNSKNEIHGDEVAKDFGFKGGLVPGVTVSAYLIHPAAVVYGKRYLELGFAHVRVNAPLYDEESFRVEITSQEGSGYSANLIQSDGKPTATADVHIPVDVPEAPSRRGDAIEERDFEPPQATPENMRQLMEQGCKAFVFRWNAEHEMGTYLRDRSEMASSFYKEGFANPSFVLGISNWVLSSNANMNPWVHMETRSQNFAAIPANAKVLGEMTVKDLFQRKGHEFVDATINLFDFDGDTCFASIELRAIYKLRGL